MKISFGTVRLLQGQKARVLVPLCLLVYLHTFIDELLSAPTARLVENAVCIRYYRGVEQPNRRNRPIPELECKILPIQSEVIFLLGWLSSLDYLPGTCLRDAVIVLFPKSPFERYLLTEARSPVNLPFLGICGGQGGETCCAAPVMHRPVARHVDSAVNWWAPLNDRSL